MDNILTIFEYKDKPKQHPFCTLSRAYYYDKPDIQYVKINFDEFVIDHNFWSEYLKKIYPNVNIRYRTIKGMLMCFQRFKNNFFKIQYKKIKIAFVTKKYYLVYWRTLDDKIIIKFSYLHFR